MALSGCTELSELSELSDAVVAEIAANTKPAAESFDDPPGAPSFPPGDSEASRAPAEASPAAGGSETNIAETSAPETGAPEIGTPEIGTPAAQTVLRQETLAASQDSALSHETHPRVPPLPLGAIEEQPAEPVPETPAPTAAIEAQPAEPAAPPPDPPDASQDAVAVTIQLASVTSEGQARALWARYQQSYPDLLGDRELALQREDLGDLGTFYRVRTSRYADRARADSVCAQLKAQGQDCHVYVDVPGEAQGRAPVLSGEERRKLFEEFFRAKQEG